MNPMDLEQGKIIVILRTPEDLYLQGETPILRMEKDANMRMKMRSSTKFEVLMDAFCKNSGLKKESLTFWFTDELQPHQTPDQVGMKTNDTLQVYDINSKENPKNRRKHTIPPSSFCDDFKKFFSNTDMSDVALRVGDTLIPAHKTILAARCKKFQMMFQRNGLKESREAEVTVACTNSKLFSAMLEYIYGDEVKISSPSMALDLMILADEYLLPRLKEICENEIIKSIDAKNVASLLESADKYNAMLLKNFCLDYILHNYVEVRNCREFKEDLRSPDLMHEVIEAIGRQLPMQERKKRKTK